MESWHVCPGKATLAPRVCAMSSRSTSIGAMYAVLFRGDQARTCAQTRPDALSITQAPESPPTRGMSVGAFWGKSYGQLDVEMR